ncbi:hypothetical protein [Erwinia phage Gungnir39]|nr:hypothetical protein [Erwinia phage Gungnir39]
MSVDWSRDELYEFEKLVDSSSSSNQLERINGRLDMRDFIEKHGKEKCDAMWSHLNRDGKIEPLRGKNEQ